ncbi:helix-hairpin-helix domain-containing protein [Promethearchaeum syntrophicum]|uniref:Helix-hairpin-helix domain-containing protein n=1 Tax=Promethearchaeum syntrophicum TaxID=2594042 RepID=A0A5B9DFD0_9ARCH|nr:helix-hairpin-helix domain-containing protein [Candidatus Prometheoarchaeum syntrophicum]QEE17407.1 hypothetical protein DSAG12_03242 [Candidatus Prometheoarchaeum syntrophicum]
MLSKLHVIIDGDSYENFQKLIDELEKLDFYVERKGIGKKIVQIPPNGGVLILKSKDLEGKSSMSNIQKKMQDFFKLIPNGVIIYENFNQLGGIKRDLIQKILFNQIFNTESTFNGIVPTRKPSETALCIKSIAKREQIEDNPPILSRTKRKSKYLSDYQVFFIEGLLQCGPKKAKALLKVFNTPQEIINTILYDPDKISRIKGFGKKFIETNQKLLQGNLK